MRGSHKLLLTVYEIFLYEVCISMQDSYPLKHMYPMFGPVKTNSSAVAKLQMWQKGVSHVTSSATLVLFDSDV